MPQPAHQNGVDAYKRARAAGGSTRDAVTAFFDAEPAAKADAIARTSRPTAPEPPGPERVAEVILGEEQKFIAMLDRAPKVLRKIIRDPAEVTGETLAMIHHTHGYDPTVVESALDVQFPSSVHDEYLAAYARHRDKSSK